MSRVGAYWIFIVVIVATVPGPSRGLSAQTRGEAHALPLDVAASLRSHNSRSPINMSSDGHWVAHTIQTDDAIPRDSISRRYTATGVPLAEGASRMEATLTNTRSGEVVRLGNPAGSSWAPVWSPDGERVAFYSDEGGAAGLWVWDRETRRSSRVPDVTVRPFFGFETVQWMSDSQRLLVKILPSGVSIDQKNALEGTSRLGAQSSDALAPAVMVRRSEPLIPESGSTTEAGRSRSSFGALRPSLRWAEVDLAIVDLRRGTVQRLVESSPIQGYALSPDEMYVAFTVSKGAEPNSQQSTFDLAAMDIATSARRLLGSDLRMGYGIEWSWAPDSRTLAYISSGQLGNGGIAVYNVEDGGSRSLHGDSIPGFDPGQGEFPPLWDASGTNLYAVADGSVWRIDVKAGNGARLKGVEGWRVRSLVWRHTSSTPWSNDGGSTAWLIARKGDRSGILAVDLTTGDGRVVLQEPKEYLTVFSVSANDATGEIVFVSSGQQHLHEIFALRTEDGRSRRISRINESLDRYPLGSVRMIEWQSDEGDVLQGALLLPPDHEPGIRRPLIVYAYGGSRAAAAANRFGLLGSTPTYNMQILATRGYAVLYPDAPVREGRTMLDLLNTVMPGVDAVVAQGYADADRLAIMGHSYGSFSTLALITQTTRFKAAVITAAVIHPDLFADYLRDTGYYEHGQGRMGGSIWEHPDRYFNNSPLFRFDEIETPLLIGQGEQDGDLAPSEAIFAALQRLDRPVEYRLYRGERHVITRKDNVLDFWNSRLDFLSRHLDVATDSTGSVIIEGGRAKPARR